jgi:HlyD family secretion protein
VKTRRILISLAIAAGAAVAIWYASRPEPVDVVLHTVDRGRVESTVANTRAGTVDACRRARLSLSTGGQIARLPIKEGDRVTAGEVLIELWNDDLSSQLKLSELEETSARARAGETCALADVASNDAERLTKLREKGLASEESAEHAIGDARAKRFSCEAARSAVRVAGAQVAVNRAELERTILRAPFSGIIAEITGELSEFVTPSPIGIPTPPAVDLIDDSCLYVSAPIDEVDAPAIKAGMEARISLDAFPKREFPGRVRRVAPYVLDIEKQARTVDVEADFLDPGQTRMLMPGYSADLEVLLDARENVLRVPTEAVLEGPRVLVYSPDSRVIEDRTIQTGLSNWRWTEVTEGLQPGERVVLSVDREGVRAGARARPEPASEDTAT